MTNTNGVKELGGLNLIESDPDQSKNILKALVDERWLGQRSRAELVALVKRLAREIDGSITQRLDPNKAPAEAITAPSPNGTHEERLMGLPESALEYGDEYSPLWELTLQSLQPGQPKLIIEVYGGFSIGRKSPSCKVDLDLTEYAGEALGVSRVHASMQPRAEALLVSDLSSSNGTKHNGKRVEMGNPVILSEGDEVTFGSLTFRVIKLVKN